MNSLGQQLKKKFPTPVVEFYVRESMDLEGKQSHLQWHNFILNYIHMCTYTLFTLGIILGNYKIMVPYSFYKHPQCYFSLFSFCIDLPPHSQLTPPIFPISPLYYSILLFSSLATPKHGLFFSFPGFCNYSRLYTHIWRSVAKNHRWERTFGIWLSGFGILHSM